MINLSVICHNFNLIASYCNLMLNTMGRTNSPSASETSVTLRVNNKRKGQGVMIDSIVFIDTSEDEKRSSSCLPVSLEEVCHTLSGKLSSEFLPAMTVKKHSSEPPPPVPEKSSKNSFVGPERKPAPFPITKCPSDSLIQQSVRCALVGDSAVGKTSMLLSYTTDAFPEVHNPTMYDKFTTTIIVNGKRLPITICDTAGQDDFAHLRPLCYPKVDVILVCFSVVDKKSFDNVRTKWLQELKRQCPTKPYVLIGTQVDKRDNPIVLKELRKSKQRPITKQEGQKLAHQCRAASYVECSALTQLNLREAFDEGIVTALELNTDRIGGSSVQCTGAACNIL